MLCQPLYEQAVLQLLLRCGTKKLKYRQQASKMLHTLQLIFGFVDGNVFLNTLSQFWTGLLCFCLCITLSAVTGDTQADILESPIVIAAWAD